MPPKVEEQKVEEQPKAQEEVKAPLENVGAQNLAAIADKADEKDNAEKAKEEEEKKKAEERKATIINVIRKNIRSELQDANAKSRLGRHGMADQHRSEANKIAKKLNERRKVVRDQKVLDYEFDYLTGRYRNRKEFEQEIKDHLASIKKNISASYKTQLAKNETRHKAYLERVEAVQKEKAAREANMAEMIKKLSQSASSIPGEEKKEEPAVNNNEIKQEEKPVENVQQNEEQNKEENKQENVEQKVEQNKEENKEENIEQKPKENDNNEPEANEKPVENNNEVQQANRVPIEEHQEEPVNKQEVEAVANQNKPEAVIEGNQEEAGNENPVNELAGPENEQNGEEKPPVIEQMNPLPAKNEPVANNEVPKEEIPVNNEPLEEKKPEEEKAPEGEEVLFNLDSDLMNQPIYIDKDDEAGMAAFNELVGNNEPEKAQPEQKNAPEGKAEEKANGKAENAPKKASKKGKKANANNEQNIEIELQDIANANPEEKAPKLPADINEKLPELTTNDKAKLLADFKLKLNEAPKLDAISEVSKDLEEIDEEKPEEEVFEEDAAELLNKSFELLDEEDANVAMNEALDEGIIVKSNAEDENVLPIIPAKIEEDVEKDEEEAADKNPKAAKKPETIKDIAKDLTTFTQSIDPDIKPMLDADIAAFTSTLDKITPGSSPKFTTIRSAANRRKYESNEKFLSNNEKEIDKISEDWQKKLPPYHDNDVKQYGDAYDVLAKTWYELTREFSVSKLGEKATQAQIVEAIKNRSIPEDSAKQIVEYTGIFDDAGMIDLMDKIVANPYMRIVSDDVPMTDAPSSDGSPSEYEHSVDHEQIAMYSAPDKNGVRQKYIFNRSFLGFPTPNEENAGNNGGKKGKKKENNTSENNAIQLFYAEQLGLAADAVDEKGNYLFSEQNRATIAELSKRYGIDETAIEDYNRDDRLRKNENLSNAIRNSIFFRHINPIAIRLYSLYDAREKLGSKTIQIKTVDDDGHFLTFPINNPLMQAPFPLAPGMDAFTEWSADKLSLDPAKFKESLATLLGDATILDNPAFDRILARDTGICSKDYLQDIMKIFMVIDYFELTKRDESPENKKNIAVLAKALGLNPEDEKLKDAKLADIFSRIKLSKGSDWHAVLRDSLKIVV